MKKFRPTPALLVAFVALFAALTGGTALATSGSQAKPVAAITWHSLDLNTNWNPYSSATFGRPGLQYTKDLEGFVHLRGTVSGPTTNNTILATLPTGFRPKQGAWVSVGSSNNSFNPFLINSWIENNGRIHVVDGDGANNSFVSFEGVEFYAG